MAEEPIVFPVSDNGGTEKLIALLSQLGIIGEETYAKIVAGVVNLERSEQDVINNQTLMNAAFQAGLGDASRLGDILDSLSGIELKMAAETVEVITAIQDLGVAEQAAAIEAKELAASFEAVVSGAAAGAVALKEEMAATSEGTSLAMAYRTENYAVAESEKARADASVSASAAMKEAKASVAGLTGDLVAYVGAISVFHDIDAYESVRQQLQAVAGAGTDVSDAFQRLSAVAVATQTPVETVGRAVSTFYSGIKKNGGSINDAVDAVNGLASAFYNTNTPAVAAQRVIHDFAEAAGQGKFGTQQFNSAMRQAPAVMQLIAQAAGVTTEELKKYSAEQLFAVLSGDKLRAINSSLAAEANGTLKGAFVALNNQIIAYIGSTGQADAITKVFSAALRLIGSNISVIIPVVETFFALWAADKIKTIVTGLQLWQSAQLVLNGELAIADALTGNWIPLLVALGIGVGVVVEKFGLWQSILNVLSSLWNATVATWNTVVAALGAAWAYVVQAMAPLTAQIMPALNGLVQQAQGLWSSLKAEFQAIAELIGGALKTALGDNIGLFSRMGEVAQKIWDGAISPVIKAIVVGFGTTAYAAVLVLIGGLEAIISTVKTIIDWVTAAIKAFAALSGASASAGGASGAPVASAGGTGHARDGGSFTVAGGSGVDTRLIAVSPGEHVTVTTPSQFYGHSPMPTDVHKFRDGGTVDFSKFNVTFNAANDNSSGAYKAANASKYYSESQGTDYSAKSIRENNQRRAAEAAAKAAQEAAYRAQLQAAAAAAQAASQSAADAATDARASRDNGGDSASGTLRQTGNPNAPNNSFTPTPGATREQNERKEKALQADQDAMREANRVTSVDGVSIPTGSSSVVSAQQAELFIQINGIWGVRPGVAAAGHSIQYAGNSSQAYAKFQEDQQKPATAFRDGGTFTIPGGSGVDSRFIQLLASPGEQVTVETPAQRYKHMFDEAAHKMGGKRSTVINIHTPDVQSFGASRRQVASDLKRRLGRLA